MFRLDYFHSLIRSTYTLEDLDDIRGVLYSLTQDNQLSVGSYAKLLLLCKKQAVVITSM